MIGRLHVAVVLLTAASLVVSPAYAEAQQGQDQNQAQQQQQGQAWPEPSRLVNPKRRPERPRRNRPEICAVSRGPIIRGPSPLFPSSGIPTLRKTFRSRCLPIRHELIS